MFPWVVLGRFMPLWILWLAILNLAWGFYWPTYEWFFFLNDDGNIFRYEVVGLAGLNGLALVIREVIANRPIPWLDRRWAPLLLLTATMAPASVATIYETFRTWDHNVTTGAAWMATALFALLVVGVGWFYSQVRHSLAALAVVTLATCTVLAIQAVRVLDFDRPNGGSGVWLVEGVLTLLIFGTGIFFLRSQRTTHH